MNDSAVGIRVDITPTGPITNVRGLEVVIGKTVMTGTRLRAAALEANALLLPRPDVAPLALVAIDSAFASEALERRIAEHAGHAVSAVVCVASHSHTTPKLDERLASTVPIDRDHIERIARAIGTRLGEVAAESPPALRWGSGRSACHGNVYRRARALRLTTRPPFASVETAMAARPERSIDHDTRVLLGSDSRGRVRAVIWSWPCHAVATPELAAIDADFVGVVRARLRALLGLGESVPVLYLPGASGDIRPAFHSRLTVGRSRLRHPLARLFRQPTETAYRDWCLQVCEAARKALGQARSAVAPPATELVRVGDLMLPTSTFFDGDAPEGVRIRTLGLGAARLVLIGAEISNDHASAITTTVGGELWVSGLAGSTFGYFPTDAQVRAGGYEPERSQGFYGLAGRFRPGLDELLPRTVAETFGRGPEYHRPN